jgi:hypothetical protein
MDFRLSKNLQLSLFIILCQRLARNPCPLLPSHDLHVQLARRCALPQQPRQLLAYLAKPPCSKYKKAHCSFRSRRIKNLAVRQWAHKYDNFIESDKPQPPYFIWPSHTGHCRSCIGAPMTCMTLLLTEAKYPVSRNCGYAPKDGQTEMPALTSLSSSRFSEIDSPPSPGSLFLIWICGSIECQLAIHWLTKVRL